MNQLTKIKELVTPILQEEDILLYDVKWHTESVKSYSRRFPL